MKFRLKLAARIVGLTFCLCSVTGSAMALDLGGLFDKVKADFAAINAKGEQDRARIRGETQASDIAMAEQSSTAGIGSNLKIEQILETYGSSLVESFGCDLAVKNAVSDTNNALRSGDLSKALMQSKVSVGLIGGCYAIGKRSPNMRGKTKDYPLSTWANLLGNQLAIGLSLESKMGVGFKDSFHKTTIENTKILLSFANSQNENGAAEMLVELNKAVDSTQDPTVSSQSALTGTVESIESQYQSNTFSFDQKYIGKTLTVTGKISHIRGNANSVVIEMLGTPGKDIDHIRLMDNIYFNISDSTQMSKVTDLTVGERVKIRGVYTKQKYSSGVNLVGCEILK